MSLHRRHDFDDESAKIIREEFAKALGREPKLTNPENIECKCGRNMNKICKGCTLDRRFEVKEFQEHRKMKKSKLGPIRRFIAVPELSFNAKRQAQRLDALRQGMTKQTGIKISRRMMREHLHREAMAQMEKDKAALAKSLTDKDAIAPNTCEHGVPLVGDPCYDCQQKAE